MHIYNNIYKYITTYAFALQVYLEAVNKIMHPIVGVQKGILVAGALFNDNDSVQLWQSSITSNKNKYAII